MNRGRARAKKKGYHATIYYILHGSNIPHLIGTMAEGKQAAVLVKSIRIANPLFIQTAGNTLHSHGAPTAASRMLTGSLRCYDAHTHGPAPAPDRVTGLHPLALLFSSEILQLWFKGRCAITGLGNPGGKDKRREAWGWRKLRT